MDKNLQTIWDIKKNKMKNNFEANNMKMEFFKDHKELQEYINKKLKQARSVSVGGSMTVFETGVIDCIKNSNIKYFDRYEEGLTKEELQTVFRNAFFCDLYFTSTNALSEDGSLFNIDGNGNRVAAMIYGPKEVIVIAGKNKVCADEETALKRLKQIAAPANNVRLKKNNPCTKAGVCMNCKSPERICSSFVKLGYQGNKNRITVCLVEQDLGY